jgi:hypothetical protein
VNQGTALVVSGTAPAGSSVSVTVQSAPTTLTTTAAADGSWSVSFDTSQIDAGSHTVVRAIGAAATEFVSYLFVADILPPTTTATYAPTTAASGWVNAATVSIALSAIDNAHGSGVKEIHLIVDGIAQVITGASASTTINNEGSHAISYWAVDNQGNVEATNSATIRIDRTPPITTASLAGTIGSNGWFVSSATLTLSATDNASGVASTQYSLDNGATWTASSSTVSFNADAIYAIQYRSTDVAGNQEPASTITFKIDKTAPVTTASVTGTAGSNGWYKAGSPVTLTLTATDNLSGVALTNYTINGGTTQSYSGSVSLSDGNYTVTYWSVDVAGNVEGSHSLTLKVDQTPPTISASRTPAANANGWNNSAVTVSFSCADSGSGLATACPAAQVLNSEGVNQSSSGTVTDMAGNSANVTVSNINIDLTAPTITGSATPAPNAAGWNNTNVTVSFSCSDALSGIASCAGPTTLTTEGSNQGVTGSAADKAGNGSSATVSGIKIDKTAPVTSATVTGTVGSNGWYKAGSPVQVSLTASDNLSGVAVTSYTINGGTAQIYAGPIAFTDGRFTVLYWSLDRAGNLEAQHSLSVNVDQTPPAITPTISPAPNSNGWNNGSVTVSFTCSDAMSGLSGTCPASVTLSTEGANQTVSRSVGDNAGNLSTASVTINIDLTKPVTLASVTGTLGNNGWYKAPGPAVLTLTATDNLSGVALTNYTVNGGAIQTYTGPVTFSDGRYTVAYWSTDRASNVEAQKSISFKVDETPPAETETLTPAPNSYGWNNSAVAISFTCSDAMSGLATACPASVTKASEGANQVVSGTVSDLAGNVTTVSRAVNIDLTKPVSSATVKGTTGNNAWFKAGNPVVLTLTATDNLSGVATTQYKVNGGATNTYGGPVTFTDGVYTVTYWSTDKANNVETSKSISFKVDQTAPVVTVTNMTNPATFILNQSPGPNPTYTVADATSGVATRSLSMVKPNTPSGVGTYTYTITATDIAGNATTYHGIIQVIYRWGGWAGPLTSGTSFAQGTTIAVEFTVLDYNNALVTSAVASLSVDGTSTGNFTYSSKSKVYLFNLSTSKLARGFHLLTVKLDDGSTQSITITLT